MSYIRQGLGATQAEWTAFETKLAELSPAPSPTPSAPAPAPTVIPEGTCPAGQVPGGYVWRGSYWGRGKPVECGFPTIAAPSGMPVEPQPAQNCPPDMLERVPSQAVPVHTVPLATLVPASV